MTTIKTDYIPTTLEEYTKNLLAFYDGMNEIAMELEADGIDTSYLFYTEEELQKLEEIKI